MLRSSPISSATTAMSVVTATETLTRVRAARSLLLRSVSSAIKTFSCRARRAIFSAIATLSLEPQGSDWIELGRFHCRPKAEKDTDDSGNRNRQNDGRDRSSHGHGSAGPHHHGDRQSRTNAEHATDSSHNARLHQELHQNVAAARPQRLADPYLMCPLSHRGQHDIHDHDAPDDHENGDQPNGSISHSAKNLVTEMSNRIAGDDAEGVILGVRQVFADAHKHARLIFGLFHNFGRDALDADPHTAVVRSPLPPRLLQRAHGDVDEIVLALS